MSRDSEMQEIAAIQQDFADDERAEFNLQFAMQRKNPTTALLLSIFLGAFGADRFYIGDTGKGIGKLLTLGGIGVWGLVDWFLIQNAAQARNALIMQEIRDAIRAKRGGDHGTSTTL